MYRRVRIRSMFLLETKMKRLIISIIISFYFLFFNAPFASADSVDILEDYIGFSIAAVKNIERWQNRDGTESGDGFEGCDFERMIVFTDNTYLTCKGYRYKYAYNPKVVILSNGSAIIMVVGDDVFEMSKYSFYVLF